jgi:ribonuclease T1
MKSGRSLKSLAAIIVALLLALYLGQGALQPGPGSPALDAPLDIGGFPVEERGAIEATLALIDSGGPYPYAKDGTIFSNREGLLPRQASGYYREYTVKTPGSPDRGARRIVTGGTGEIYYTDDHYDSFVQLK